MEAINKKRNIFNSIDADRCVVYTYFLSCSLLLHHRLATSGQGKLGRNETISHLEISQVHDAFRWLFFYFRSLRREKTLSHQSLSVKVICFDLTLITASTTNVSVHFQMDQESAMMIFLSYQKLRMPTFSKLSHSPSQVNAMVSAEHCVC